MKVTVSHRVVDPLRPSSGRLDPLGLLQVYVAGLGLYLDLLLLELSLTGWLARLTAGLRTVA